MGQCYSVNLEAEIKDSALLVKSTNEYIARGNFADGCWEKSDLTTAEGCIRALLAGDTQSEMYRTEPGTDGQTCYTNSFNATYSWERVLYDWFHAIAPALGEQSSLVVDVDEGRWALTVDEYGGVY